MRNGWMALVAWLVYWLLSGVFFLVIGVGLLSVVIGVYVEGMTKGWGTVALQFGSAAAMLAIGAVLVWLYWWSENAKEGI